MAHAGRPKRSTLADIAAQAGVSIKTVSRVIRREPVSEATRARVMQVVAAQGYRPITAPRSAAGDRSYLIGLLHLPPVSPFVAGLIMGAGKEARKEGYHLLVEACEVDDAAARTTWARQLVIQSNLDGIILTPPLSDDPAIGAMLAELAVPTCSIAPSGEQSSGPSVGIDDRRAAREVTELLLAGGHRAIAFLTGAEGRSTSMRRLAGFEDAVRHVEDARPQVMVGDYSFRSGFEAGQTLLAQKNGPTAVFASNDEMAAGVLVAAHKLGRSMPESLSVFGFDDSLIASAVWPPLSTVRQPMEEMGCTSVQLLLDGALRPPALHQAELRPHRIIAHQIIERETNGPAPTG